MKNLIINADDFGMSKEVNKGIIQGVRQGIISSVSVMTNMPYFDEAIKFLKKYPKISVGLHFNITEGSPLSLPKEVETLIREDNSFYFWSFLIQKMLFKQINLNDVQSELKAQYVTLAKTRIPITHIDSHHHIHLTPSIFKLVSDFADRQKIVALRGNQFNFWNLSVGVWQKPIPTQVAVNFLLVLNNFSSRKYRPYQVNRFYDLNWGKNLSVKQLTDILEHLPNGITEFICHLAVMSDKGNPTFLKPRQKTLNLITNNTIKKLLKENGITLVPHAYEHQASFYGTNKFAAHLAKS
jgi:hypothetical protein